MLDCLNSGKISPFGLLFGAGGDFFLQKSNPGHWLHWGYFFKRPEWSNFNVVIASGTLNIAQISQNLGDLAFLVSVLRLR